MLAIKSGAIFLGDSHENRSKLHFLDFLKKVKSGQIRPTQLFFMGDMFDYLSCTDFAKEFYKEQIWLINEISKSVPCFYFEGNHDFNLEEIFPEVKVFGIYDQPVKFNLENGEICELAHGDRFMNKFDFRILMILRNKTFLKTLNFIDKFIGYFISKAILRSQENKILYKKPPNFKELIARKIHNYSAKFIIEGHYHQDEILEFDKVNTQEEISDQKKDTDNRHNEIEKNENRDKKVVYINLNSFAIKQKFYTAKVENGEFLLVGESLNQT